MLSFAKGKDYCFRYCCVPLPLLDNKFFRKKIKKICKCNGCNRAKLTRKILRTPEHRLNLDDDPREKEVVCADTMEVLKTRLKEDYKHVLAFKHSDVKRVRVHGLHTKSGDEVLKYVKDLVEVQLAQDGLTMNRYMQMMWEIDGGRLIGRHIRKYLHENESTKTTKVTWTPRSTPKIISVSERANRTINEMTLAPLLDSGLPSVFWYKAFLHAVHIIKIYCRQRRQEDISHLWNSLA